MLLARFKIQPTEIRNFLVDYSDRLGDIQLISSIVAVIITPATTVPLIIVSSISADGDSVILQVSGGEDGEEYKVEIQITTSVTNETWEDELIYIVEDI